MPLEKLLRHSFYNKFAVQNCSKEVANRIQYIRQSSNGLGRGDVQPNVWFESRLASQTRSLKGAEAKQRNKRQTRGSLRLLSPNCLREKLRLIKVE